MMLIAALMLAQAPTVGATAQPVAKKKPEQVCQYIDVTGSHQRQRVCHDKDTATADQDMDFGNAPAGMIRAMPSGAAPTGVGTPPK